MKYLPSVVILVVENGTSRQRGGCSKKEVNHGIGPCTNMETKMGAKKDSGRCCEAVFTSKRDLAQSRPHEKYVYPSGEDFVNREIGHLNGTADGSVYANSFGKYLSTGKGEPKFSREEKEKRDRARRANKIYRQVCNDTGLKECFFSNFSIWSDFVTGNMSEAEFVEQTETTARAMALEEN